MAQICFKAKVRNGLVAVPELARRHCDMPAFRNHPTYGTLANSDLFPNVLARIRRDLTAGRNYLRLDSLPANVRVDQSGFLAVVTIAA